MGRKNKSLPTIPAREVDIPLVVDGASCSPLTGGINANDSSIGPSIGMSSMMMQPLETIPCHKTQMMN
jgi:hypothetical protein